MMKQVEKRSRRRGKGSLQSYTTKAGLRWRFQLWIPIDPEQPELGEKKYSRGGFATSDEADDAMQEAILKRKNDEKFHGVTPTLAEYGADWLDALTLEPSTMKGYRRQFNNYLVPHLGAKPLDKITGPAVGKLYKLLRERGGKDGAPLSANTVNKTSITLAAILDAAMEDGFIVKNPARLKKIVKAPTGRDIRAEREEMVTWTAEQLKAFIEWDRDVYEDELFPLWFTLARTGMRRGEALALQWRDLDFKSGRISIRRAADSATRGRTKVPKSGGARVIDADAQLMTTLKTLKSTRGGIALDLARPTAFIFGHDDGRLRDPVLISNRWIRRMAAANKALPDLPRIPLHALRHTHATLLLQLGESPKVVQERLGHASISITMDIYSHVNPTMQRAAADRFAALLE
ncbi:tyrosine-type recombinase/integrase [Leucobacter ruminantium]|uniref:Site-specific integrase n=1 Tax=Leucobacter ruminantium TaxID=1289170 RepID=A0A939RXC8_9MICO|nr:site-specific integrase [Leucobacter ruminantium]MBO1805972.1 site-specific integrase [Leucobacter ruminantium]